MPVNTTEISTLDIDSLPQFYRNKPHDEQLFGRASTIPVSDRGLSHMLLLNPNWHDQYAQRMNAQITVPAREGEEPMTDGRIVEMSKLIDQIKCVAALTRLVQQGTSNPTLAINKDTTPTTSLNDFVHENPYFYITARQAHQEGKDPRYVAKLEEVIELGYDHESFGLSMDLIVSDSEGNRGHFPLDTKAWSLAHLATTHRVHLPGRFRYINDGYR